MSVERGGMRRAACAWARQPLARGLDLAIVLSAIPAVGLAAAAATAPRLTAVIPARAITARGGQAFAVAPGFSAYWPYVVPSHPAMTLKPDDVKVSEDGRLIGTLTPSHDAIRSSGGGRYNLWDDELWFSSGDGSDPRNNGRTYGVLVETRLAGTARAALVASLAALAVLVLGRVGPAVTTALARAGLGRTATTTKGAPAARSVGRSSTFGVTFALFCAAMLGFFCWTCAVRPMPLVFGDDSFTYVYTGVLWSAGQSVAGQSSRDVGYAALTRLALWLGSLGTIPPLQLLAVTIGLGCLLGVLYLLLEPLASRLSVLSRVPRWISAACACAVAAGYGAMLARHDAFVLDIYRAMAEALHLLPTALALLLFVLGWVARTSARRLGFMVLSIPAAYLSTVVKPHTSVAMALCIAGLAVAAVRAGRGVRSPSILSLCVLSALVIVPVHRFDVWVTPSGFDFGPKTLFCNHLDVAEPVFDASTPERSRVKSLLEAVVHRPAPGWTLLGFHGDACMYGDDFNAAMVAAARSEGTDPAVWEGHEFLKAVARNPVGYGRVVWKQLAFFLSDPLSDPQDTAKGVVTDAEWRSLEPYAALIRMSRNQFDVSMSNWVPESFPGLAAVGKALLRAVSASFATVTLGGTFVALVAGLLAKGRVDVRPETTVLAVAAFTTAFVATTALAHTFDVHRYLTDLLPFSLLWWSVSAAYLAHGFVLLSTAAARSRRSLIPGPAASPSKRASKGQDDPRGRSRPAVGPSGGP